MKTTEQICIDMLLTGKKINKFDFLNATNSVCLAQRIKDIQRKYGWNVKRQVIKGKGTLLEYWLDENELDVILSKNASKSCVDCTQRHINCHSACKRYEAYKKINEEKRACERKIKTYDADGQNNAWGYIR